MFYIKQVHYFVRNLFVVSYEKKV